MGTTTVEPGAAAPGPKTSRIGLTVIEYKGGKTTLCAGCGHNAISERIGIPKAAQPLICQLC